MPFEVNRRGPGRPPKVDTTHTIHPDGSYSNRPTVETKKAFKRPKLMEVFKTKSGSQYQIIDERGWGVYVSSYPYAVQPRVDDCDFWDNEKLEEEIG